MTVGNFKMALHSIRTARWRSLFTMFGIIIGVVSVVTTVSLGEGVKKQVSNQIANFGSNVVTVRPGQANSQTAQTALPSLNGFSSYQASTLTDDDLKVISKVAGVGAVVPFNIVSGTPTTEERQHRDGLVIGTNENLAQVINQNIEFGEMFATSDQGKDVAVIGKQVAEKLFGENVPVGKIFQLKGRDFVVRGLFEQFDNVPLNQGTDFNNTIFIPYVTSRSLASGSTQIAQILIQPTDPTQANSLKTAVVSQLKLTHGNQSDFSVLTHDETIAVSSSVLTFLTGLVASIAAISLLVGGVGVMNIMLLSVTERTREIGIRKAIGATNQQILSQFLIEGIMLSVAGGVIGTVLSLLVNLVLRLLTNLQPVVSWQIMLLSVGVSVVVGIVFSVTPALKASRKDPIDALRYE